MKYSAVLFLIFIFSFTAAAQKSKPSAKTRLTEKSASKKSGSTKSSSGEKKSPSNKKPIVEKKIGSEKEEFENAVNQTNATKRIEALQKFIENFPKSEDLIRAQELIVSARAQLGDEKLQAGEIDKGVSFFKLAVKDAPKPMSEKLFADVILQFPTNLFFRGQRGAALDIAEMIEEKAEGNAKQILGLATFYLGIESASQARRLAEKAIETETASPSEKSNLPAAYQTLGIANRLGFRLEESANAYAKALELDPDSAISKRSLAEMKRATGKFDEAVALYRELIEKDENDLTAKTGLTLSLFDAGKRAEAEAEMEKTLEANGNNFFLLVGAAYWYAAHGNGQKAVDMSREAIVIEPRYTWAYIALARGYLAQKLPLEAEKTLLAARNYGSFPTLDYEIAAARLQAGFYREAADELKKNFKIKNGSLETTLGGRIPVEAEDFIKLLSLERQASIFEPNAADTAETAQRLKSLLVFSQEINSANEDIEAINAAADEFVKGDDKMKIHRQLFVAGRLLDKKKALPKVLEMTQAAIQGVDSALDVPNPSAAVMADELYAARTQAISRNEVLLVPEVPRQTLSVILRGRIEEITGWTLYQQEKTADAVIRLKRALSVLPEKSSWWRSTLWRLGTALEADGKPKEALENYIKSYTNSEQPDATKYSIIESLYEKVNGNTEGLEQKIGVKPAGIPETFAKAAENAVDTKTDAPSANQETKINSETENNSPDSSENKTENSKLPNAEASPNPENKESKTSETESPATEVDSTKSNPQASEVKASQTENSSQPATSAAPEVAPSPVTDLEKTREIENNSSRKADEKPASTPNNSTEKEVKIETSPEPTPTTEPSNTTEIPPVTDASPKPETEIKNSETPQINQVSLNNAEETKLLSETKTTERKIPEIQPPPDAPSQKKFSVVVTENSARTPVEIKPKKNETPAANSISKTTFDPVIINLPKSQDIQKPKKTKQFPENPSVNETEKSEPARTNNSSVENAETQEKPLSSEKPPVTRPRVVVEDKLKDLPSETGKSQCRISLSQENISLINNGGSIGILVELMNGGSVKDLSAATSSPQDVTAVLEPDLGNVSNRAFFVVKSISDKVGVYTVTIESPCGKKEIQVSVR